jgi:PQQ-like domain
VTQPPNQPPNEPPQGGYGTPPGMQKGVPQPPQQAPQPPQTPPPPAPGAPPPGGQPGQPGYGYPQQQPAPGYGYPAAPPQQPAAGNPYAQPTQPAQPAAGHPYGQPQQPGPYGGQPPYGYPTQPQYAGPGTPGGPGGGGPFKGRTAAIIGAAVAVLLVAGGVVWAVGGDDDKKPEANGSASPSATASGPVNPGDGSGDGGKESDPEDYNADRQDGEAKVLWYKSAPDAPGKGADAPGQWITDQVAVKAAYKQVFGYKVADGAPAWTPIEFPQEICAASRQATDDGKAVVAYKDGAKDGAKCNQLVEIDLATGKKGWTQKLPEGALFDSTLSVELSISKDTLVVGRSQSGVGFAMSDGHQIWSKKEERDGACFPSGFTGGSRVILALSCGAGQSSEHEKVEELDPATGKTKWSKDLPKGWSLSRVYSTSPVVLYLSNDDKKQWNISTLKDNSGTTRSQVDTDASFAPECGWAILDRDLQGCTGTAADADTLYLPTDTKSGPNEIVALNLSTGKEKWRVKPPSDTKIMPLKVEGGNVIAYQAPSYDKGGAVLSIPTSGSHTPKTLLQNPESTADIENGFYSKALDYVAGRFYISTTRLTGNDQSQEKLMMAFGN